MTRLGEDNAKGGGVGNHSSKRTFRYIERFIKYSCVILLQIVKYILQSGAVGLTTAVNPCIVKKQSSSHSQPVSTFALGIPGLIGGAHTV